MARAMAAGIASASVVHAAETSVTDLPPVSVTAPRIDESASRYLVGVKVISAQDIARSRASTLTELLGAAPGIPTRALSGSPNPLVDMRGFGVWGDQNTLVLLDGMRVREYEQLTVNWEAIPLSSIERIEILPPSSAVLYGGGATGGTINIVTKTPQPGARSGYAGAGGASYDTWSARAGGSLAGDSASFGASGSYYTTDNYRDNNHVRIGSAQAGARWTGDAGSVVLKFGADDQSNGLPGPLSEARIAVNRRQASTPFDSATQSGGYFSLTGETAIGSADLLVNLGYRQRETSASFLPTTPFRNFVDTRVGVWTLAPRLSLKPHFGGWDDNFLVGVDLQDWNFNATAQPTFVSAPQSTQRNAGLYAQYTATFATQTTLALGARMQSARYGVTDLADPASNGSRSETLYAWDVSARQTLWPSVNAYARVGGNFRLPNVNDNFNQFTGMVTLLAPQTAHDVEVGLQGNGGALSWRAALYRVDLDNEIFFDPVTLGSENRQPTRRKGAQLEARWQVDASLGLYVNYIYADARFRSGTVGGVAIAGNRVPLAPGHTVNAGLAWSFANGAGVDFDVRYVGASTFDNDETNTFGREIPAYTVADIKLSLKRGGWLISGGVQNLFAEKYFSYGVYTGLPTYSAFPMPERTVFASVQYDF